MRRRSNASWASPSHWDGFMYHMKALSDNKVKSHEALNCAPVCHQDTVPDQSTGRGNEKRAFKVLALYEGHGRGAEVVCCQGYRLGAAVFDHRVCRPRA